MITPYQFTILQQLVKGAHIIRENYGYFKPYYFVSKEEWPNQPVHGKVSKKAVQSLEKLGLLTRRIEKSQYQYVWEIYWPGIMESTNPMLQEFKVQKALGSMS
jgi:hypothetical protein